MKKFVFLDANGTPQYTSIPSDDNEYQEGLFYGECLCKEVSYETPDDLIFNSYFKDEWKVKPQRPSNYHNWDIGAELWVTDYERLKGDLSRELNKIRIEKNQYAIEVNAVAFDGDNTAQTNLKNKIEEVRSRIELGIEMPAELLVWRDANNQTHSWPDINSYYQFLQSYAIALADRGTRLYLCMWQHKAAIQALIDANTAVQAIQAYPVDQGWE